MIVEDEKIHFYHRVSSRSFGSVVWTLGTLGFSTASFLIVTHVHNHDARAASAGSLPFAFSLMPAILVGALALRLIHGLIFPTKVFVRVAGSTIEYRDESRTGLARGSAVMGTCEVGDVRRVSTKAADIVLHGTTRKLLVIPKIVVGRCDEFMEALRALNPKIRGR